MDLDNPGLHVWNKNMSIKWESQCIPCDVTEFLYLSNTDDVTDSIEPDKYLESDAEEDMEFECDNKMPYKSMLKIYIYIFYRRSFKTR